MLGEISKIVDKWLQKHNFIRLLILCTSQEEINKGACKTACWSVSFSSLLLIGEPLVNAGIWSGRRATTFLNDFSPLALKRILPIFHMYHPCVCVYICMCVYISSYVHLSLFYHRLIVCTLSFCRSRNWWFSRSSKYVVSVAPCILIRFHQYYAYNTLNSFFTGFQIM